MKEITLWNVLEEFYSLIPSSEFNFKLTISFIRGKKYFEKGEIICHVKVNFGDWVKSDGFEYDWCAPNSGYYYYEYYCNSSYIYYTIDRDDAKFRGDRLKVACFSKDIIDINEFINKYKSRIEYKIYKDIVYKCNRIKWTHDLVYCNGYLCRSLDLLYKMELNIKEDKPCLHFVFDTEMVKIKKGDRLVFADTKGTPIVDVEASCAPYGNKKDKIDFFLLEDDIKQLMRGGISSIIIIPKGRDVREITFFEFLFDFEKLSRKSFEQLFKFYVETYYNALKDIGIIQDKPKTKVRSKKLNFDYCSVYLMHDEKNGYHKIGMSKEPKYREKTLQGDKPSIKLLCAKKLPSRAIAEAFEAALHKVYADKRVRGEWFELLEEDVLTLKEALKE